MSDSGLDAIIRGRARDRVPAGRSLDAGQRQLGWAKRDRAAADLLRRTARLCREKRSRQKRSQDAIRAGTMVRRLALLAVGASALVAPVAPGARRTAMKAADAQLEGMIGRSIECGDQIWDPLELSQWRDAGEMRACELANGRAAMLGWVGWLWPQVFGLWKGGSVTICVEIKFQAPHAIDATLSP